MRQKRLLTLFVVGAILLMAACTVQSPAQIAAPTAGVQVEAQTPEEPTSTAKEESLPEEVLQGGNMEQVEEPQQPTSIADLAGVWSRPKAGYPKPGKYLWQLNPDGIDQVLREDTIAGKVVKLAAEDYFPNQWSVEGTEWQAVALMPVSDEMDIYRCNVNGRYEIQPVEGDGIQFVLIDDECGPRRVTLTGGVWQREAGSE